MSAGFVRPQADELTRRLSEPRRFIQVVTGPRQVGKTTMVLQATERSGLPTHYATADLPTAHPERWIEQQWEAARLLVDRADRDGAVLVLDEIQKVPGWSEVVKYLWDEDTRLARPLKVVILGSAPLLVRRGLGESLAGRFESIRAPHWSFDEMRTAFGWDVEQYIFYGAYPGAASLVQQPDRWARYIRDSLIEPVLSRDILLLSRVDKPALLRQVFNLGCAYSGQILSYTKMLGQLQDAGNTTTIAHYLDLLGGAGLVIGLRKYSGGVVRRRSSSPKLQVLNTALIAALSGSGFDEARQRPDFWGRVVESAIGAHLANAASAGLCEVYYWRDRNREVDFVVRSGDRLVAIEVKSGRAPRAQPGIDAFSDAHRPSRTLLVGGGGIDIGWFLSTPITEWL
ncbi:MAG: ATP-binding protein [bacterium]|nr:ATP-binding protein [bacterium]